MAKKKKLPTVGTSAAVTAFCAAEIRGPGGSLWIDGNGKITRTNGTLEAPKPNAFSLEAQAVADRERLIDTSGYPSEALLKEHCPGSTSVCRESCYVHGLEKHATDTYELYRRNSTEIRRILASRAVTLWAFKVGRWIARHAPGGFRWHVSGDVYSARYARWIAQVCRYSPRVPHWIYTRSFDLLPELVGVSTLRGGNLAINLSADRENYPTAKAASDAYGGLRICYLTDDGVVPEGLPEDSVVFPDYKLRGGTEEGRAWFDALPSDYKAMTCQVDYMGKSEARRCGPCARCLT